MTTRYPLDLMKSFDKTQQGHFDKTLKLDDGLVLLEGGPGCGKTFLTSNIQLALMEQGAHILSIYPSHYARLVGIAELTENSKPGPEADPLAYPEPPDEEDMEGVQQGERKKPSENIDVVMCYKGGSIRYRTIQAVLGIRPQEIPGKPVKFKQQVGVVMDALTKATLKYKYIFIDEISMVSQEMLSDAEIDFSDEKSDIQMGLFAIINRMEDKYSRYAPLIHATGDFNQLRPVSQGHHMCEEFLKEGYDFSLHTVLQTNHRAERQGISSLIEHVLETGRLPQEIKKYDNVVHLQDPEEYQERFKQAVAEEGGRVLGLSFTNKDRKRHTAMAAEAYGYENPFFIGNQLRAAEGKGEAIFPEPMFGPKFKLYFYNGELLEIQGMSPSEVVVPGTEWAPELYQIRAHKCTLYRDLTEQIYPITGDSQSQFYLLEFSGSDAKENCQKARYMKMVGQTLNKHLVTLGTKDINTWIKCQNKIRTPEDLVVFLMERDDLLGRMVEYLCFTMNKEHIVQRYLEEYIHPEDLFCRYTQGPKTSLFNLLWANIAGTVKHRTMLVRFENALTCHSAQGSGRDIVFLNVQDLRKGIHNPDRAIKRDTFRRALYVGISRAKQELTILT